MDARAWTEGAAQAVRAAAEVLRDQDADIGLSVEQIGDVLTAYTAAHPDEMTELREEIEHLKTALLSRATIEQAKGMLMRAEHCTPEEAFDILRKASQRENVKLRDVALRIVEGASRGNASEPPTAQDLERARPPGG